MHHPWGGQTYDPYETMITWVRKIDGSWWFDYTIFDKWVEFMIDMGIKKEIGCYSMIPWKLSFLYFDQATNSMKELKIQTGRAGLSRPMVKYAERLCCSLKIKGWFDITHIAMDERPMPDMLKALKIIREADPNFKVSLAGSLHKELSDELNDYCIAIAEKFSEEMKTKRKAEGKITTYYTCCARIPSQHIHIQQPGRRRLDSLVCSERESGRIPALGIEQLDYRAVTGQPLLHMGSRRYLPSLSRRKDLSAFRESGGRHTGIRENRILKTELQTQNKTATLRKLERVLESFDELQLLKTPANVVVEKANLFINGL